MAMNTTTTTTTTGKITGGDDSSSQSSVPPPPQDHEDDDEQSPYRLHRPREGEVGAKALGPTAVAAADAAGTDGRRHHVRASPTTIQELTPTPPPPDGPSGGSGGDADAHGDDGRESSSPPPAAAAAYDADDDDGGGGGGGPATQEEGQHTQIAQYTEETDDSFLFPESESPTQLTPQSQREPLPWGRLIPCAGGSGGGGGGGGSTAIDAGAAASASGAGGVGIDLFPRAPVTRQQQQPLGGGSGVPFLGLSLNRGDAFNEYALGRSARCDVEVFPWQWQPRREDVAHVRPAAAADADAPDPSSEEQRLQRRQREKMDAVSGRVHAMISNRHCRIYCLLDCGSGSSSNKSSSSSSAPKMEVYVEDTSGNGTVVNSTVRLRRGERRLLHTGDEVCLINPAVLRNVCPKRHLQRRIVANYSFLFVNLHQQQLRGIGGCGGGGFGVGGGVGVGVAAHVQFQQLQPPVRNGQNLQHQYQQQQQHQKRKRQPSPPPSQQRHGGVFDGVAATPAKRRRGGNRGGGGGLVDVRATRSNSVLRGTSGGRGPRGSPSSPPGVGPHHYDALATSEKENVGGTSSAAPPPASKGAADAAGGSAHRSCGKQQQRHQRPYHTTGAAAAVATSSSSSTNTTAATVNRRLEECYDVRDVLGSGTCGEVRRAIHRRTGEEVAVKIIPIPKHVLPARGAARRRGHGGGGGGGGGDAPGDGGGGGGEDDDGGLAMTPAQIRAEAEILRHLHHPYIVPLRDVFVRPGVSVSLVMDLLHGGDLLDRILLRGRYDEGSSRRVMRRLLAAVTYLHDDMDVVHRDLKPENILLVSGDDDVSVKVTDFGLAKRCTAEGLKTFCGTPQYFAPEVLRRRHTVAGLGRYGKEADCWSLGVILYVLLSGTPPFDDMMDDACGGGAESSLSSEPLSFDGWRWEGISGEAVDLVTGLLRPDPKERLSAREACDHRWILTEDSDTHRHPLEDPLVLAAAAAENAIKGGGQGRDPTEGSACSVGRQGLLRDGASIATSKAADGQNKVNIETGAGAHPFAVQQENNIEDKIDQGIENDMEEGSSANCIRHEAGHHSASPSRPQASPGKKIGHMSPEKEEIATRPVKTKQKEICVTPGNNDEKADRKQVQLQIDIGTNLGEVGRRTQQVAQVQAAEHYVSSCKGVAIGLDPSVPPPPKSNAPVNGGARGSGASPLGAKSSKRNPTSTKTASDPHVVVLTSKKPRKNGVLGDPVVKMVDGASSSQVPCKSKKSNATAAAATKVVAELSDDEILSDFSSDEQEDGPQTVMDMHGKAGPKIQRSRDAVCGGADSSWSHGRFSKPCDRSGFVGAMHCSVVTSCAEDGRGDCTANESGHTRSETSRPNAPGEESPPPDIARSSSTTSSSSEEGEPGACGAHRERAPKGQSLSRCGGGVGGAAGDAEEPEKRHNPTLLCASSKNKCISPCDEAENIDGNGARVVKKGKVKSNSRSANGLALSSAGNIASSSVARQTTLSSFFKKK